VVHIQREATRSNAGFDDTAHGLSVSDGTIIIGCTRRLYDNWRRRQYRVNALYRRLARILDGRATHTCYFTQVRERRRTGEMRWGGRPSLRAAALIATTSPLYERARGQWLCATQTRTCPDVIPDVAGDASATPPDSVARRLMAHLGRSSRTKDAAGHNYALPPPLCRISFRFVTWRLLDDGDRL